MTSVLMQDAGKRDCHNAAIATACGVSYAKAAKATGHIDLPGPLESPVFSNPWNLYRALIYLGFWKRNVTLSDLLEGNCTPGKTIVLLHMPESPTLQQHWVVWGGCTNGEHRLYWGTKEAPVKVTANVLTDLFERGWPNCAFEVYKASFWRLVYQRLKSIFKKEA